MDINKKEGIELLEKFGLPTVNIIDIQSILDCTCKISEGLTVRLSPKGKSKRNVMLPSIYNCKDKNKIREFIDKYSSDYNVFMHKTIPAEKIGSVSRLSLNNKELLILEMFKSFNDREKEIIHNRMIVPIIGGRFMVSEIELLNKNKEDYTQFIDVFQNIRKLPFSSYELEFFIWKGKPLFTDFTVQKTKENIEYEK